MKESGKKVGKILFQISNIFFITEKLNRFYFYLNLDLNKQKNKVTAQLEVWKKMFNHLYLALPILQEAFPFLDIPILILP